MSGEVFNRLLKLTPEEAQLLVTSYWAERNSFLKELAAKAGERGFDLPDPTTGLRGTGYLSLDMRP